GCERSEKQNEESGNQARKESKKIRNVLADPWDRQDAEANKNKCGPCHPENRPAQDLGGRRKRGAAQQLRCPGVLGELIEPGNPQDAAHCYLQHIGNDSAYHYQQEHFEKTRYESTETAQDLVHGSCQLSNEVLPHRDLTSRRSTARPVAVFVFRTPETILRSGFPLVRQKSPGSQSGTCKRVPETAEPGPARCDRGQSRPCDMQSRIHKRSAPRIHPNKKIFPRARTPNL